MQRTQPRTAASPERSRTPTPSARTAAAKQHTRPASWLRRSYQLAFPREVEKIAHGSVTLFIYFTWHNIRDVVVIL